MLFQSLISQKVYSYEQYDWSDYTEAEQFDSSFFQSAFKDNEYMYKSIMYTFQLSQNGISVDQVQKMYNGYQTSTDVILYSSWSLMNVIHSGDATQSHWGQTGSLASIRYVFVSSRRETLRNELCELFSDRP